VLGWPGGPEETRAAGRRQDLQRSVRHRRCRQGKLIFFTREGFWTSSKADLAAGSSEFDLNLVATYTLGKYAPFMQPIDVPADAAKVFGEKVLKTMQYDGKHMACRPISSLHFMYVART